MPTSASPPPSPFDSDLLAHSWRFAWASLGLTAPDGAKAALIQAWTEPHRSYHTLQHLSECLKHAEASREQMQCPGEIELALWFHDAIYDPLGRHNEARSADWACEVLVCAGASTLVQDRVRALIMATVHAAIPTDPDAQLLVDMDLAILGADPVRFAEYDAQVRAEYRCVPDGLYRYKRRQVLASFLARPTLYATELFRGRFELQARENLRRSG